VIAGPATGEHLADEALMAIDSGSLGFWTSDSLAEAHDLDLDGYADLMVGAEGGGPCCVVGVPGGVVCIWYGPILGAFTTLDDADACIYRDHEDNARLGRGLAAPGDITGDGWPDLALGAPLAEGVTGLLFSGEVWIVSTPDI
jgi:hypothetical protein